MYVCIRMITSRILRCSGHVARMEEYRSAFKTLTGKATERDVQEGRWEDNSRMDLKEIGVITRNWVD
jgi:hypothetical protein